MSSLQQIPAKPCKFANVNSDLSAIERLMRCETVLYRQACFRRETSGYGTMVPASVIFLEREDKVDSIKGGRVETGPAA
jgi:hypothetical protein